MPDLDKLKKRIFLFSAFLVLMIARLVFIDMHGIRTVDFIVIFTTGLMAGAVIVLLQFYFLYKKGNPES